MHGPCEALLPITGAHTAYLTMVLVSQGSAGTVFVELGAMSHDSVMFNLDGTVPLHSHQVSLVPSLGSMTHGDVVVWNVSADFNVFVSGQSNAVSAPRALCFRGAHGQKRQCPPGWKGP